MLFSVRDKLRDVSLDDIDVIGIDEGTNELWCLYVPSNFVFISLREPYLSTVPTQASSTLIW